LTLLEAEHPAEAHPLAGDLRAENRRLVSQGRPFCLQIRGDRLCLRGPLPPRNGVGGWRRQRISLGLPATLAGLEEALQRLALLERQLERNTFRWDAWSRRGQRAVGPGAVQLGQSDARATAAGAAPLKAPSAGENLRIAESLPWTEGRVASEASPSLAERVAAFETSFFADPRRRRRTGSRTTWTAAYLPYLRRLVAQGSTPGADGEFGITLLESVLDSYGLTSRSRQQCAIALAALARHQELELPGDWTERAAGYGLHAARFRQLPSDSEILSLVERIPNPGWRLVYGLMATYGLRNHETFFCDCSSLGAGGDRVIRVLPTSKTGEHQVWPFQPEWVDRFGLERLARDRQALPPVLTDLGRTTLQQVGRRVAEQFRRYGLPITPYDLRHAWAVRTIHIGLPDTVAARMMGHSVGIHTRTYHHWITRRDQQQAVDAALARQRVA
jgi:integrase